MSKLSNILALTLLPIALLACGGSETNGDEQASEPATGEQASATTTDTQPAADNTPAPAGDYPQATVDGTMALFMDYLSKGEYQLATDVCDQTSIEVQEAFAERAHNLTYPHPDNENVTEEAIEFLRDLFSQPYKGAEWVVVTEDTDTGEGSARITLADGRSREVALVYQDEAWFVFPFDGFLDWGEQAIGGIMQEQQSGNSTPETPAEGG